jgi:hypothetical protein
VVHARTTGTNQNVFASEVWSLDLDSKLLKSICLAVFQVRNMNGVLANAPIMIVWSQIIIVKSSKVGCVGEPEVVISCF